MLAKTTLEAGILALTTALSTNTIDPVQARQDFARQLAALIDAYVRSGTVTVATTGTATAQTGTGTIS